MSRAERKPRRLPALVGLGLAAALAVAGCSSGQLTQTDSMAPAVNGAVGEVGKIKVRNASVAFPATGSSYPSGGAAPLVLTIVNVGTSDDELVRVTSPIITGDADVQGDQNVRAGGSLVVGKDLIDLEPSVTVQPTSSAPTTTVPSSPENPQSSTTPPLSSSPESSISVATSAPVDPPSSAPVSSAPASSAPSSSAANKPQAIGELSIVLSGLSQAVRPGQTVTVTLIFRDSGQITLTLPVAAPGGTPAPEPTSSEAAHG